MRWTSKESVWAMVAALLLPMGCQKIAGTKSTKSEDLTNSVVETGYPAVGELWCRSTKCHPEGDGHWCTATLVRNPEVPGANVYVLTAAHCVSMCSTSQCTPDNWFLFPTTDFEFRLNGVSYAIESFNPKPNWVYSGLSETGGEAGIGDVALVKLVSPVVDATVTEVNFASAPLAPAPAEEVKLLGYGIYQPCAATIPVDASFCEYVWKWKECEPTPALGEPSGGLRARYCEDPLACTDAEHAQFLADCTSPVPAQYCQDPCIPGYPIATNCGTQQFGNYLGCLYTPRNYLDYQKALAAQTATAPANSSVFYPTGTTQLDVCKGKYQQNVCVAEKRSALTTVDIVDQVNDGYDYSNYCTTEPELCLPRKYFAFEMSATEGTLCHGDSGGPTFSADGTLIGIHSSGYWLGGGLDNGVTGCGDFTKDTLVGFYGGATTVACVIDADCLDKNKDNVRDKDANTTCSKGVCKGWIRSKLDSLPAPAVCSGTGTSTCPAGQCCVNGFCSANVTDQGCGLSCLDCTDPLVPGNYCLSGACVECTGTNTGCAAGYYCDAANSCALCDTWASCGASCVQCPGNTDSCLNGVCVCSNPAGCPCTSNADCLADEICWTAAGECVKTCANPYEYCVDGLQSKTTCANAQVVDRAAAGVVGGAVRSGDVATGLDSGSLACQDLVGAGLENYYRIYLFAGETLNLRASFTTTLSCWDILLALYSADPAVNCKGCSSVLGCADLYVTAYGDGCDEKFTYTAPADGWYTIRVENDGWTVGAKPYDLYISLTCNQAGCGC
ncbi:MAG: trypsin-like serine protease [Pseudomonadota bacterium]